MRCCRIFRRPRISWNFWMKIRISRITMPRDRSSIRIYIECRTLIPKRDIYVLEAAIKKQFFANKPIVVKIIEHYHLGGMSPEEAMKAYRDSILLELKNYHLIEYNLFRHASQTFTEDGILVLEAEDSVVNHSRSQELARVLEKIFVERLGIPMEVRVNLGEHRRHAPVSFDEDLMAAEAARISEQVKEAREAEAVNVVKETKKKEYHRPHKGRMLDSSEGYGRDFEGESIPISQIQEEMGEVIIEGEVIKVDTREIRTGNTIIMFVVTDHTDSITTKIFATPEQKDDVLALVATGKHVRIQGNTIMDKFDKELTIGSVKGIKPVEGSGSGRMDTSPVKRVELHCHTKMSDMDGVSDAKAIVKQAIRWGHKAIAITDHGVVQAFPEAMHAAEKTDIKIIYGCEGYLVDDHPGDTTEDICKAKTYHIIILAQNDIGRINLYRLVSEAHLTYFQRRPRIPRSLLIKYREGT